MHNAPLSAYFTESFISNTISFCMSFIQKQYSQGSVHQKFLAVFIGITQFLHIQSHCIPVTPGGNLEVGRIYPGLLGLQRLSQSVTTCDD